MMAPLSSSLSLSLALSLALAPSAAGRAPPAPALLGLGDVPPPWPATWLLNMSTAIMPANYNGFTYNVSQWGYVDFDWSNNKQSWAKKKPMTCEEDLLTQVQLSAADAALSGNPGQRYYVYRNSIKALSWFSSVRELLVDPAYAKWFLPFSATPPINGSRYYSPPCDSNYDPPLCSALYHDQTQSPAFPKGDGDCAAPACDTGAVPSGEYLWDFRQLNTSVNGVTLREWWIETWLFGPTGGGSPLVSGYFFDDGWMGTSGPSEVEGHARYDMGLSDDDLHNITAAYNNFMREVNEVLVARGKFTWQLMAGGQYAGTRWPYMPLVRNETCAADLREFCVPATQNRTLFYGLSPGSNSPPDSLPLLAQDIASFQLVRSPYSWLGHGWLGTGSDKPQGFFTYLFPDELNQDFGEATTLCTETVPNASGVFVREFERATVQMDCNGFTPTITWRR